MLQAFRAEHAQCLTSVLRGRIRAAELSQALKHCKKDARSISQRGAASSRLRRDGEDLKCRGQEILQALHTRADRKQSAADHCVSEKCAVRGIAS
jgi:hypothetical protein